MQIRGRLLVTIVLGFLMSAGFLSAQTPGERADRFLEMVNLGYQALYRANSEAQWLAATDVRPEHDRKAEAAGKAVASFNGNPAFIQEAKELLRSKDSLTELQVRQLQKVLLNAAEGPMTAPKLVADRVAAETAQASAMNGFRFQLGGSNVIANDIDRILRESRDLAERKAAWESSKEIGRPLKPGLIRLRDLRNGCARELGHEDYLALQVARYGMGADEMVRLNEEFLRELTPLYRQLHTWTKHQLAKRYGQPVPKRIPAHWINNRWGQEWGQLVDSVDLDGLFVGKDAAWVTKAAEDFYEGMGFPRLPQTFWTRSDLFPTKPGEDRRKNAHASCWHLDLESDIRSLMSVEPNAWWWTTAHHELGHGYYFMAYTRPEVPPLLRDGANPAFHEGIGELIGMASVQTPYLKHLGLMPADRKVDEIGSQVDFALVHAIPFLFWSSGTMLHWEADVYRGGLKPEQWNRRWWEHVEKFQGIEAPGGSGTRGEEWCDAATKTHINDNPCYYYSYAVAFVLKFQLHDHIARKILHQPPQACDYAGNKEVGAFLQKILAPGATRDWRTILREATGEDLSTRALKEYFKPLMSWLEKENSGREIGWE